MNKTFQTEKKGKTQWVVIRQMPHDPQYKLGSVIPGCGVVIAVVLPAGQATFNQRLTLGSGRVD